MIRRLLLACFIGATVTASGVAHRLDEYLQATLLSIGKHQVLASVRLVPGVAVSTQVLALIDTDRNGVLSAPEQHAYAQRVLRDLSLEIDGTRLPLQLTAAEFPSIDEIKEGLGQIQLQFRAALPSGRTNDHQLSFANHHQPSLSVYLMNCLVPPDPALQITAQTRNVNQSLYQVRFQSAPLASAPQPSQAVGWGSLYRLGIRHIAEGTDHLFFLLALLLPAPLAVAGARWGGPVSVRLSIVKTVRVVTAFTVGHSMTLALAGLGFVHAPSRWIEVLIAFSILISALHALRPIFPGKEAGVACFFGLIHGLAFAGTIAELGLDRWQRVLSILAFNLGIETMQLAVVAAILPSLLLLSRTPLYRLFQVTGGVFAGGAALGWLGQRLFRTGNPMEPLVTVLSDAAVPIAMALFLFSFVAYWLGRDSLAAAPAFPRRSVS